MGRGWGKVMTLADSFTWFDWWRCVQVRTSPTTNKLCLVLKIWQSPTSESEGCWALLLLSRIFFPPSPSCSIQFKIHEIHTCAMKNKEENRTDDCWPCTSNNISVFFFLGHFVKVTTHLSKKKDTYVPLIFVNYNFCLPGVKFLLTLTSTWTINHASTSKWVNF